jgi:hypothetical protein
MLRAMATQPDVGHMITNLKDKKKKCQNKISNHGDKQKQGTQSLDDVR